MASVVCFFFIDGPRDGDVVAVVCLFVCFFLFSFFLMISRPFFSRLCLRKRKGKKMKENKPRPTSKTETFAAFAY